MREDMDIDFDTDGLVFTQFGFDALLSMITLAISQPIIPLC